MTCVYVFALIGGQRGTMRMIEIISELYCTALAWSTFVLMVYVTIRCRVPDDPCMFLFLTF